jgi:hypothetical protein
MDIFPTLLNLSLSDTEYDTLGVNLLDPKVPHYAFHASGLAVGPDGGALVGGPNASHYFEWEGSFESLKPSIASPEREAMALRYRSLMSLLDYYFMSEKKLGK